ncbi:MAG: 16S rRNA (uracil(1498)-N(3))-methyltransferase [Candidatus Omnitrophica bacterium]|nr:16S rRNA (uracil(1498)-N(3))-methyltransferase [Candidatus Omnitrophota bacterium]
MHRFYSPSLSPHQKHFRLEDPQEVNHLSRVLRLHSGDECELINGCGALARVRLITVAKQWVDVELVAYSQSSPTGRSRITLVCALPKKSVFDDIIEKCTELGVDEIVPVITERTEVAPSNDAAGRMNARFKSVVISASKQCKRLWFPRIHPVIPLETAVEMLARDGKTLVIPWLGGERVFLHDALRGRPDGEYVFFIGPEGDFTSREADDLVNRGAIAVSLGDTVLRIETAAIAVVAYARLA